MATRYLDSFGLLPLSQTLISPGNDVHVTGHLAVKTSILSFSSLKFLHPVINIKNTTK